MGAVNVKPEIPVNMNPTEGPINSAYDYIIIIGSH